MEIKETVTSAYNSFYRRNKKPLDYTSLFSTKDEAAAYASGSKEEDENGTIENGYPGFILAIIDETVNPTDNGIYYIDEKYNLIRLATEKDINTLAELLGGDTGELAQKLQEIIQQIESFDVYTKTEIDAKITTLNNSIANKINDVLVDGESVVGSDKIARIDLTSYAKQDNVNKLDEKIDGLHEDISGITEDIESINAAISGITEDVESINGEINTIKDALKDAGKIDDVLVDGTSIVGEDKIARIDLTSYAKQDNLNAAISGISENLDKIVAIIEDKADIDTISALTYTIETIRESLKDAGRVNDIQINGTSIIDDNRVANIDLTPYAKQQDIIDSFEEIGKDIEEISNDLDILSSAHTTDIERIETLLNELKDTIINLIPKDGDIEITVNGQQTTIGIIAFHGGVTEI